MLSAKTAEPKLDVFDKLIQTKKREWEKMKIEMNELNRRENELDKKISLINEEIFELTCFNGGAEWWYFDKLFETKKREWVEMKIEMNQLNARKYELEKRSSLIVKELKEITKLQIVPMSSSDSDSN